MTPAARERAQVRAPLLLVSAAAWMVLVIAPIDMPQHVNHLPSMSTSSSLQLWLAHNPTASLAIGWALMLMAMMVPLLTAPVRHVRDRSFASRRRRAIALFLSGYAALWTVAGVILVSLALAIRLIVADPSLSIALAAGIAVLWQCSPVKQRCLNRGHVHPALAATGFTADIDAVRFGLTHGFWCAGSCWALMLTALLFSRAHVVVMAIVCLWLAAERLESPMPLEWRLRLPSKAGRIAVQRINVPGVRV